MNQFYATSCGLLLLCLSSLTLHAQVRGQVFADQNANGHVESVQETGLAGVLVEAYDVADQRLATTRTDAQGHYQLPAWAVAQPVRLVFSQLPAGYWPTRGQYLTRYVRTTESVQDLALLQPRLYQPDSLQLALSLQPIGNHQSTQADSLGVSSLAVLDARTGKRRAVRVDPGQTGSLWGLAYNPYRGELYAASLAKRHSGFGPLGSGGIYALDPRTGSSRGLVSLDQLGVATAPAGLRRDLSAAYEAPQRDSAMFAWVGKAGLGGLALAPDGTALYTVNLYDQGVYRLTLPPPGGAFSRASLAKLAYTAPRCAGGQFRPFALTYHEGQLYVGGVCDAAQSGRVDQLTAQVLALDPTTGKSKEVLTLPLQYKRGQLDYGVGDWNAWTDDSRAIMLKEPAWWAIHPQPILSDIAFTATGDLVLGFMDRLGHQMVTGKGTPDGRWAQTISLAAGDVLQAAPRRASFKSEANARTGDYQSAGQNNGQGPAGGEFYHEDGFSLNGTQYHQESGMGGLALLGQQVLVSTREPVAEYNAAGLVGFDPHTGHKQLGYVAYHDPTELAPYLGRKTNHVGDIAVLAPAAPTWLGQRVWQDCNEDGQQDASEIGLPGVLVELWKDNRKIAEATTDSLGYSDFTSYSIKEGIQPHAAYRIQVPVRQPRYGLLKPSQPQTATMVSVAHDEQNESDYLLQQVQTKELGELNQVTSFGFQCLSKPTAALSISCQGVGPTSAFVELKLTHYKPQERHQLLNQETANQVAAHQGGSYESAQTIPPGGLLGRFRLDNWLIPNPSVTIINEGGCYQVLPIDLTTSASCLALLTHAEDTDTQIGLYPNPTREKVAVTGRGLQPGSTELSVLTIDGRLINRESRQTDKNGVFFSIVDLQTQPAGTYLIRLSDGIRQQTRRVLKH